MDFRHAARTLYRNPGFSIAAIFTIALGLAATTATFSVVHAVLLKPLPYGDPDRLVVVWQDLRARGVSRFSFSHGDFADVREQGRSFSSVANISTARLVLMADAGPGEMIHTGWATTNLFATLKVPILIGRDFVAADGIPPGEDDIGAPGAPLAAILSHDFWQRRFGGDRGVLGRIVRLDAQDGRAAEIVGVLPPQFQIQLAADADVEPRPDMWLAGRVNFVGGQRIVSPFIAVARLKPDATLADAQRDMDVLTADLRTRFPVKAASDLRIAVVPMLDDVVGEVRTSLWALMGAGGFVLLIACANVAGLFLARARRTTQALAVRTALGGSRRQLMAHLLGESALISGAGTILGVALAGAALRALQAFGSGRLPRIEGIGLDPLVVLVAAATAVIAAAVFGLVPAVLTSRIQVIDVLRQGGRAGTLHRHSLRNSLVMAEVACAFVLLIGCGLMVRSFVALQRIDPGFDPRGVFTFLLPRPTGQTVDERLARTRALRERLAAIPGVTDATVASALPLDGTSFTGPYGPEAARADTTLMRQAEHRFIVPGYFAAMRTRLLEGREFTEDDNRPGADVVIIDSVLAQRLFSGRPAVGQRILVPRIMGQPEPRPFEIIGVAREQRGASLAHEGRETVFIANGRGGAGQVRRWAVRTNGEIAGIAASVRATVTAMDPTMALGDELPLADYVAAAQAPTAFTLSLMLAFAAIAIVLAVVGLYGVLATLVAERTAEIGVRMALGSDRAGVFRLVLAQGLRMTVIGLAIGVALSLLLTGAISSMLVGVTATDLGTYVAVGAGFVVVVMAACAVPAWRAATLDPVVALRQDT